MRQVTRDAKTGLRRLDKLVRVQQLDGGEFYIHVEVQLCRQRRDPDARLAAKFELVREAYDQAWSKQRILDFVDVLDWLMQLSASQKAAFEAALSELERRLNMPYVNSMVRDAIARGEAIGIQRGEQRGLTQGLQQGLQQGMRQGMRQGIQQGIQQGLLQGELQGERKLLMRVLRSRFGTLPGSAAAQIEQGTESDISRWADRALAGLTLAEVLDGK